MEEVEREEGDGDGEDKALAQVDFHNTHRAAEGRGDADANSAQSHPLWSGTNAGQPALLRHDVWNHRMEFLG